MQERSPTIASPDGADAPLDALYRAERDAMLRLAVLLVGSRARAEEIVQDAFLAVGTRWSTIDNPGAYLRTAVVNGCRMAHRRDQIEARHDPGPPRGATSTDPAEIVELAQALAALRDDHRRAIVLRYFLALDDAEIAELLGCREATVRSHIHRALRRLRKELS